LYQYDDIDKVFNGDDVVYILIETDRKNNGHYLCLIRRGKMIEFFDSYGKGIEKQKNYVRPELLNTENHIQQMLYNSPYKLSYNHHKFQDSDPDIATCGRWITIRAMHKDLPLSKFKDMVVRECVNLGLMPDDWTILKTQKFL
jgi:hypothetical protein